MAFVVDFFMFAKTTCKSMHLDTMDAQTASLQASTGGGLRVMMRRRVGESRSRREARLHLETNKLSRKSEDSTSHLMLWQVPAQL